MRCTTCGKWFQSANAKDLTCPDCVQKARKEKAAAKNAPPTATKPTAVSAQSKALVPPPPPKPKAAGGTNQWLDSLSDVKIGQPDQPPRPKLPPSPPVPRDTRGALDHSTQEDDHQGPPAHGNYRDERGNRDERGEHGPRPYQNDRGPGAYREGNNRGPGAYRENDHHGPGSYRVIGGAGLSGTLGQRPRQPMEGPPGRGPRPSGPGGEQRFDRPHPGGPGGPREGKPNVQRSKPKPKASKPAQPPKPKREKIPPPPPFVPTAEQAAQVENRYLELAQPIEFDGIRTQIAQELDIPKTAVKKIIKDLRDRQSIPSWWELQVYKGSEEELARIKVAYEPFLPVPAVGIHKKIAEELNLKPGDVYQAIKAIREALNLPQYNDPSFHEEELAAIKKAREERAAAVRAAKEQAAAAAVAKATATPVAEEQSTEATTAVAETPAAEATTTTPSAEEPSAETTAATTLETEAKEVQVAAATATPPAASVVTVSNDEKDRQETTPHI